MPYRWRSGRICPCTIADQGLNKIPDKVTDRQALFVGDVLATGYWAARISEITEDDTVLIIGAGPTGICTLLSVMLKIRSESSCVKKTKSVCTLSGNIIRKFLQFRRKNVLICSGKHRAWWSGCCS